MKKFLTWVETESRRSFLVFVLWIISVLILVVVFGIITIKTGGAVLLLAPIILYYLYKKQN